MFNKSIGHSAEHHFRTLIPKENRTILKCYSADFPYLHNLRKPMFNAGVRAIYSSVQFALVRLPHHKTIHHTHINKCHQMNGSSGSDRECVWMCGANMWKWMVCVCEKDKSRMNIYHTTTHRTQSTRWFRRCVWVLWCRGRGVPFDFNFIFFDGIVNAFFRTNNLRL